MLKLKNVTLIALTSRNIEAHRKALDYSCRGIEFGAVKLITQSFKTIDDWNKAVIYELTEHVDTDFAMFVHADGYIIHPELWNDEWLQYDYIGAPWPVPKDNYSNRDEDGNIFRVGNSVSLRSKRILDLPKQLNIEWKSYYGNTHEDGFLCVHHHKLLEKHGCRFAPLEVAKHFSKECEIPENIGLETFAFHKDPQLLEKYKL